MLNMLVIMFFMFTLFLVFFLILIYANSMSYVICLFILVFFLMFYAVSLFIVQSLTGLIIIIVYVGAIIILIGYICAVCPNVLIKSNSFKKMFLVFFSFFGLSLFLNSFFFIKNFQELLSLRDFFYSLSGFHVFCFMILILFLVLLIISSQYLSPKGPFRSLS